LYKVPTKKAKNPIRVIRYFADAILLKAVPSSYFENTISKIPHKNNKNP